MARPNPRDPYLGFVALTSCPVFLGYRSGLKQPILQIRPSSNSHSMHHLSVHYPLTTVHRFLCPKCNHLR
jgi:hypothetical protein